MRVGRRVKLSTFVCVYMTMVLRKLLGISLSATSASSSVRAYCHPHTSLTHLFSPPAPAPACDETEPQPSLHGLDRGGQRNTTWTLDKSLLYYGMQKPFAPKTFGTTDALLFIVREYRDPTVPITQCDGLCHVTLLLLLRRCRCRCRRHAREHASVCGWLGLKVVT